MAVPGRAGACMAFAALSSRAKQLWLFMEPCVREPLMVTPLRNDKNPHFKAPGPQGWAYAFYPRESARLRKPPKEASRSQRSQRSDCPIKPPSHGPLWLQAIRMALDRLCDEVEVGSELLCSGLPAASLDGRPLAAAITAHLARPSIPEARALLGGLCEAAGLCLARAKLEALRSVGCLAVTRVLECGVGAVAYRRAVGCSTLRRVAGSTVLTANIKAGACTLPSRPGRRRLQMRRRPPLVLWPPLVALRPCGSTRAALHPRTTWGGLREVDLPPLCPINWAGMHPPTYQGTQRNQNFLGTQGETSVVDQAKSASSCQ